MSLINFNKPIPPLTECSEDFNKSWAAREAQRRFLMQLAADANLLEHYLWADAPARGDGFYPFLKDHE